jgi:hypothetical protein
MEIFVEAAKSVIPIPIITRDNQATRVRSLYQSLLQVLHSLPGPSDCKQRKAKTVVPVPEST